MYSIGLQAPAKDDIQDVQSKFTDLENGELEVTLRRALDTGDFDKDYILPVDTTFDLAWAVNLSSSDIQAMHSKRGAIRFTISSEAPEGAVEKDDEEVEWTVPSADLSDDDEIESEDEEMKVEMADYELPEIF